MKHTGSLHPRRASCSWLSGLLALCVVGLGSTSASAQTAQPWLSDRDETRGAGIRTGNLELHPGVAGEVGYDSNFFQGAGNSAEPIVPSLRFRLTPSLSLETLGKARNAVGQDASSPAAPKAQFKSTLALSLDKLYSLDDDYSEQVNSQTYFGADLGAQLNVLPEAPFGADLRAGFTRLAQPYNSPGTVALDRSVVHGGGDLRWRPGSGLLEWYVGYSASLTTFDEQAYALDSVTHGFRTRGMWRFLPRTGLLYLGEVGFVTHRFVEARVPNSMPISSQLGVNGLITASFGALLMGGWKVIFVDPMPNGYKQELDTPVGRAELTWFINRQTEFNPDAGSAGFSTLKLGYLHDGYASELSSFYRIDKGYLDLSAMFGGVLFAQAVVGVSYLQHALPLNENGAPLTSAEPKEWRQDVGLYLEYRLSKTIAVFSNNNFSASPRNNLITIGPRASDSLKYNRFTALVGARWFL